MVYSKNYLNLTKIFVLRLFKIAENIKKRASGLQRVLSTNFRWLKMANNVKFRENWETCTEKHVLLKMIFTKKKKTKTLA